jgi:SpoIID/LytB domain protein
LEEPRIKVGLMTSRTVAFSLSGSYRMSNGEVLESGDYTAGLDEGRVTLAGPGSWNLALLRLEPVDFETSRATVHGVTIGVEFHWERRESQLFQGALAFEPSGEALQVINELPLESYLVSVISSEMSAACPPELLRAHAIVSRSWLLAQIHAETQPQVSAVHESKRDWEVRDEERARYGAAEYFIKWYDRENHSGFDVCADDHCQRYQGISKAFSNEAFDAVNETRGRVLMFGGEICDARYSKSCGGVTEEFGSAWEDRDVPYLAAVYDGEEGEAPAANLSLTRESDAAAWIESSPPAFCNTDSSELLTKILPNFDQETADFYRWRVEYSQDELSQIVRDRLGVDCGRIKSLRPLERGKSGRIVLLKIVAENANYIVGKELQIRRTLSRSHLYSSAFVVEAASESENDTPSPPGNSGDSRFPDRFILIGAGWGHGVGLCQIGAAVMAEQGYTHEEILAHYFKGARAEGRY